jgi:hypothetical protein
LRKSAVCLAAGEACGVRPFRARVFRSWPLLTECKHLLFRGCVLRRYFPLHARRDAAVGGLATRGCAREFARGPARLTLQYASMRGPVVSTPDFLERHR